MKWLKHLRVTLFVLSGLAMVPFLVNCVGWANYVYLKSSDRRLIVGVSGGALHLAEETSNVPRIASDFVQDSVGGVQLFTLINSGKLNWFIEGGQGLPLRLFSFSSSKDAEYSSVECPYLLIPLLLLVVGFTIPTREGVG